jgi:hypothetical protein
LKVYVAGPMSGYEEHNFPMFDRVTAWLRTVWPAATIVSPAELTRLDETRTGVPAGTQPWAYYMAQDLREVVTCDRVVLLPGWAQSRGARLEATNALALGAYFQRYVDGAEDVSPQLEKLEAREVAVVLDHQPAPWQAHLPIAAPRLDLTCPRCKTAVEGSASWSPGQMTVGWYHRAGWAGFMRADEQLLCDACMWAEPRYVEVYGPHFGTAVGLPTAPDTLVQVDPTAPRDVTLVFGAAPGPEETILQEADRLVSGSRQEAYGSPARNWDAIARFWQAHLDGRKAVGPLTGEDASIMMVLMKCARLVTGQPDHRDSQVDIAGYAKVYHLIREERRSTA